MISGALNSAPVAQLPVITSIQQQILVIKMQHNVCQEIAGRKKKSITSKDADAALNRAPKVRTSGFVPEIPGQKIKVLSVC